MKKIFLSLIALALVSLSAMAQSSVVKDVRQTYLWDVTLSMKGFKGSPNIYSKVEDAMVKDIESITDERTEIVVIPFQTSCCDVWKEYATQQGKKTLIAKIKSYNNTNVTNTCISAPLQYVVDNVFSVDKVDILKLMTDGKDNVSPQKYNAILERWCSIAREKDVYGYYIILTDAAKEGNVIMKLKGLCRMDVVDLTKEGDMNISVVYLTPQQKVAYNVRNDYGKKIKLRYKPNDGAGRVPSGYKIQVSANSPYLKIDQVVELKEDYTVEVTPQLMDQEQLKQVLPSDENAVLYVKSVPAEGMDQNPYSMIRVLDSPTHLEMINKPEKTVKFHVN